MYNPTSTVTVVSTYKHNIPIFCLLLGQKQNILHSSNATIQTAAIVNRSSILGITGLQELLDQLHSGLEVDSVCLPLSRDVLGILSVKDKLNLAFNTVA